MTNDNNTRKKANAVFFSVIMVISMAAVGFAAAPAAATVGTGDVDPTELTPNEVTQEELTHDYSIDVTNITDNSTNDTISFNVGNGTVTGATASADDASVDASFDGSVIQVDASSASSNVDTTISGTITVDWSSAPVGTEAGTVTYNNDGSGPSETANLPVVTVIDYRPGASAATKNVSNGATVYQGEEVNFVGSLAGETQLTGVSGDAQGQVVDDIIGTDDPRGTYTVDGNSRSASNPGITVTAPRVSTAELRLNTTDEDVAGSSVASNDADLDVYAEFNFENAEPLSITVEDPSGTDITDAVTSGSVIDSSGNYVDVDLRDEGAGEYTIIYEGDDDLDTDQVVTERTVEVSSSTNLAVDVSEDSVPRGTNNEYTVSGGTSAETHNVTIERSSFRDSFDADNDPVIFRNTGDTVQVGYTNGTDFNTDASYFADGSGGDDIEAAVATVEMDGSSGVGTLRTTNLDSSSIDLEVYGSGVQAQSISAGTSSSDDVSFEVTEGDLTLDALL
ncbi:surface glycoprotein [Halorubrum yunnanense]|uniref:Surface glycoprotein n=1 Tax=Halorubrum yunnanense TaxID=1526162 RepID=A0ABD5YEC9_9EURY|nr:surface glycoprotein [Halorubrum yunnanense]